MRVIKDAEELASILWETCIPDEDYEVMYGEEKPSWFKLEEFNKDGYRYQAEELLKKLRIGMMS